MRRSIKAILVSIGWGGVCVVLYYFVMPLVVIYSDPLTNKIPLEIAIPLIPLVLVAILPILYGLAVLCTPLFMATLEVLDDVSR